MTLSPCLDFGPLSYLHLMSVSTNHRFVDFELHQIHLQVHFDFFLFLSCRCNSSFVINEKDT